MAQPLQRIIDSIQSFDSQLVCEVKTDFASSEPQYREKIRASLQARFGNRRLLDLKLRPSTDGWSISVSHCRSIGGWVAIPQPRRIGFDLELIDRIREEAVARVATPEEIQKAPHFSYLWCAKEAYYKALGHEQPGTFSQVSVTDWREHGSGQWRFPNGLLIDDGPFLAAICII